MDTRSLSSRESLYSVESATSEEDEEEQQLPTASGNFRIFFLEDRSQVGKEVRLPRHHCLNGPGFLLLPGLCGQDCKCWVRKPPGLLPSARWQPPGPGCCSYPEVPGETLRSCLVSPDGSTPEQRVNRKRTKSSGGCQYQRSATGGRQPLPCLSPHGMKRQRKKEIAAEDTMRSPRWTEGDQLFAQKCWELQGFVRPLSELLDRLKMGRFDQGLSSFQQSVAMDRIQRIIGVLQKPQMGERYLGTLLQVEKMLKLWFPQIPLKDSQASCRVAASKACEAAESHNVEDQSTGRRSASVQEAVLSPFSDLSSLQERNIGPRHGEIASMADGPAMNFTWIHTSPILDPLLGQVDCSQEDSVFGQILLGPNTNSCEVVFFLQKVMAAPAASKTSAHSCPPSMLFSGSGEPTRCHSPPSALAAGSHAPRGTLGLSWSLPRLLMSGEQSGGSEVSSGKTVKCRSS